MLNGILVILDIRTLLNAFISQDNPVREQAKGRIEVFTMLSIANFNCSSTTSSLFNPTVPAQEQACEKFQ